MRSPLDEFRESLERIQFAQDPLPAVLAISGGVDSMALLHLACKSFPATRWIVAHFDHRTRSTSKEDGDFVLATAAKLGVRAAWGQRENNRPAGEGELRQDRRAFLENVRREHGARWILTAHHADDQIETFLMRLLRGTTLAGLGSMHPQDGVWLKPLLAVSKDAVLSYALEHQIHFREDETNLNTDFLRNRLRHRLIPELRELAQSYGGYESFLSRFTDTTADLREAEAVLDELQLAESKGRIANTPRWSRVELSWLRDRKAELQRRVVRSLCQSAGAGPLERPVLNRVLASLSQDRARFALVRDFEWVISCGYGYVRRGPAPPAEFKMGKGTFECDSLGMRIELRRPAKGVVARLVRPGDRLFDRKLSERLYDAGLPTPERELVPVLCDEEQRELLWSPYGPSEVAHLHSRYPYLFAGLTSV